MSEDLETIVKINPLHGAVIGLASGVFYAGAYVLFNELDLTFKDMLFSYSTDIALFSGAGAGIGLMKNKYVGATAGGLISLTGGLLSKSYFFFNHPELFDGGKVSDKIFSEGLVLILIGTITGAVYNYICQAITDYKTDHKKIL